MMMKAVTKEDEEVEENEEPVESWTTFWHVGPPENTL